MKVKVNYTGRFQPPEYQTSLSAGADIFADIQEPVLIKPLQRVIIPTGISMELPEGYEAQIRPRSGLAFKHGITVLNSPGTIDADFRGEVKILLINLGEESFTLHPGDRIAQMIIANYVKAEWELNTALSETGRGEGGYGHTGLQKTIIK